MAAAAVVAADRGGHAPRHIKDLVAVGDRRAAVLLDNQRHDPWNLHGAPTSGKEAPALTAPAAQFVATPAVARVASASETCSRRRKIHPRTVIGMNCTAWRTIA